jgi:hypothetical protein
MRIIDRIEEVVQKHKKEFKNIEVEFNKQNEKYKAFLYKDHDFIGRLLKFHLITEYYLNEYLQNKYPDVDFNDVDLRYYQKLNLLPLNDYRVAFIKPGLKQLNRIRNKFSHNLSATVVSPKEINDLFTKLFEELV